MKTILLGLVMLTAINAQAFSLSQCKVEVEVAAKKLEYTEDRLNVGEVSRTEVSAVQMELFNKQFECRAILFGDYCTQAPAVVADLLLGMKEEAKIGQRTQYDVDTAIVLKGQVDARCH